MLHFISSFWPQGLLTLLWLYNWQEYVRKIKYKKMCIFYIHWQVREQKLNLIDIHPQQRLSFFSILEWIIHFRKAQHLSNEMRGRSTIYYKYWQNARRCCGPMSIKFCLSCYPCQCLWKKNIYFFFYIFLSIILS